MNDALGDPLGTNFGWSNALFISKSDQAVGGELSSQEFSPKYQYEIKRETIILLEEGLLEDPRLVVLVPILGMPEDATRVRLKWSHHGSPYEVEFFGVTIDEPPDPNVVDCLISYGEGRLAHMWIYRVRWKHTKATYEGIWIPGDDSGSWAISIRDLHLVNKKNRARDCAKLLEGAPLITDALRRIGAQPGRPAGTGYFRTTDDFLTALNAILSRADEKLSQPKALYRLTKHSLYQGPELSESECSKTPKTLRNWLDRAGLKWADLKWNQNSRRYSFPRQNR
jgi:hypothetical protein